MGYCFITSKLQFVFLHAHYQLGNTPLVLVWKNESCSQYVIDTDNKGQVPNQQQVVLELQDNGQLVTSDDPPVVLGCLNATFIQETGLQSGKVHRACAFADSYSKVFKFFQFISERNGWLKV
ncbi:putative snurportin-1 [Helianthus anomalus]